MNEIVLNSNELPITLSGTFCIASSSFVHADRVADFDVLIYVTKGQITVTEDGNDYEINEGEVFFLKHGIHHYGKKIIKQGTSWYYVHFHTQRETPSFKPFEFVAETGNSGIDGEAMFFSMVIPKKIIAPFGSNISLNIQEFIEYLNSTEPLRRWNINVKLFQLLTECALSGHEKTILQNSLSDKICTYLQDHINDPFCAASLEKQFFLSYKYMAATFKKEKHLTMQQYHTSLRMNFACKLLRSTLLPIGEISIILGYSDMLYFSRCFRNYTGLSPTAYRKQIPMSL